MTRANSPASRRRLQALYLLLGVSAGLPLTMFTAVLSLRLAENGVDVAVIGFFAWVALVPTGKFLWAPLLERYGVPGFAPFWGRRRSWIMLALLGSAVSLAGMAATGSDADLRLTALFAVALAFWAATLEIAADGWRIELAPRQEDQAPIVAAYLWGYRGAMVAGASGAVGIAAGGGWALAYFAMGMIALATFVILAALPGEPGTKGRSGALASGLAASGAILLATTAALAAAGAALLFAATAVGLNSDSNVTPIVLALCILPFAALAALLPRIRRMGPGAPALRSAAVGPYVDLFWRYGRGVLPLLAFVSFYRIGDILALALNHPMWSARGYSLAAIAVADGPVALLATLVGVGLGGWAAARLPIAWALFAGAIGAAAGNLAYAWLSAAPVQNAALHLAVAVDQFGNGLAGAVFVVYLSLLVNPRYPAAQYAFLAGFAFLLARLLAGASGTMQKALGYDGFFVLAAGLSLAAALLLPVVSRIRPRLSEPGPGAASSSPLRAPAATGP
jgi:MFS transporter, PAT family, beta-lactamase induction signal transducer AmpG